MKKIMLIISFSLFGGLSAMDRDEVQLPSAEILRQRFDALKDLPDDHAIDLTYFLTVTQLDQTLGGQKKSLLDVVRTIESAIKDYAEKVDYPAATANMQTKKPLIIKTVLQGQSTKMITQAQCYGAPAARRGKP